MRRQLVLVVGLTLLAPFTAAAETNWIFRASYYSHDPATGQRVIQYAPEQAAVFRIDPTYQQSAYRQNHTSLHVGNNYDEMDVVETWGRGTVRPYGEWLYPYRPGATPYGPWQNPQGPGTMPYGAWGNPQGPGAAPYGAWPNPNGMNNRASPSPRPAWGYGPPPGSSTLPNVMGSSPRAGQGQPFMPPDGLPNGTAPLANPYGGSSN
ncbi:MAG: hypothetical protein ACLQNE_27230 [Thermoguttaceae bacterium]